MWLGAKILFVLTVPTNQTIINQFDFWLGGGFVFYGALIMSLITNFILAFLSVPIRLYCLKTMHEWISCLCYSHAIGRIGCYIQGCCYGVSCELWVFSQLPVQLVEALFLLAIGFYVKNQKRSLQALFWYLKSYATLRFTLEWFRADIERGEWFGLPPSLSISVLIFCLSFFFDRLLKTKLTV